MKDQSNQPQGGHSDAGNLTHVSESVIHNLLQTADLIHIQRQRLLREYELTESQYSILRILRDEGKPLPCLEIASRTITVTPGITGLVDRLEKAGLVNRRRCDQDRRVIYIELTDQAEELVVKLDEPLKELHRKQMKGLTENEQQAIVSMLENILGELDREPPRC